MLPTDKDEIAGSIPEFSPAPKVPERRLEISY